MCLYEILISLYTLYTVTKQHTTAFEFNNKRIVQHYSILCCFKVKEHCIIYFSVERSQALLCWPVKKENEGNIKIRIVNLYYYNSQFLKNETI